MSPLDLETKSSTSLAQLKLPKIWKLQCFLKDYHTTKHSPPHTYDKVLFTEHMSCALYLVSEIWNSFYPKQWHITGSEGLGFQSEHWHSGDKIYSRWVRPSCHPLHIRSRSQPVPAEQITEVLALTSEIDFLIQLSQCPRWRLRADSANRAGLREQNRFEFWPEQQTVLLQPAGARGRPRGKGRQRHLTAETWTLAQGHCLKSRWSCTTEWKTLQGALWGSLLGASDMAIIENIDYQRYSFV